MYLMKTIKVFLSKEEIEEYMKREGFPYVPDGWVERIETRSGYEISFKRYFCKYQVPRNIFEIERKLEEIEKDIMELI